jgi:hypothetical protein
MVDDRPKHLGIDQAMEIGQRALGETIDVKIAPSLPRLAEVLKSSEGAKGGIEEGEQVGDEDIAGLEFAIGVLRDRRELLQEREQPPYRFAAEDGLRPFWSWPEDVCGHGAYSVPGSLMVSFTKF